MRCNFKELSFALIFFLSLSVPLYGQNQLPESPQNLDLENTQPDQTISSWTVSPVSSSSGYIFSGDTEKPFQGKTSGFLTQTVNSVGQSPGVVFQSFNAARYRGKRVRFRASIRTESNRVGQQSQLWLRVDRNVAGRPEIGFFDNMSDRPILSSVNWDYYNIVGDIDSDAATITIGLLRIGGGKTWIDDASFEIIGDAESPPIELPRPISKRGLNNILAFSRLVGYIRYFHPSDQALVTDWDDFAIEGIRQVEGARNANDLVEKLKALFGNIAPTVIISKRGVGYARRKFPENVSKAFMWEHVGHGTSNSGGVYKSNRISLEVKPGESGGGLHPPIKADLGDGIIADIPLVVFADENGTLPFVVAPKKNTSGTEPTKKRFTGNDRVTRIADIALAWNVFQHFYPYFDETGIDWNACLPEYLKLAAIDRDEHDFEKTLKKMVGELEDGHASVIFQNVDTFVPSITWDWIGKQLLITSVGGDLPLIHVGDSVLSINGKKLKETIRDQEELVSGATEGWIRYRALQELIRGPANSTIKLEILSSSNGKKVVVHLKRDTLFNKIKEKRPGKISQLESGIFYINLAEINTEEFKEILPELKMAEGIIFDVRGYPKLDPFVFFSHLSNKPLKSPKFLVPNITLPDHRNMKFNEQGDWHIKPDSIVLTNKKVFIANERSISYAESILGIVEHYKLGDIVGATTAGTNGNINQFSLPGNYQIIWTGMKVQKHDGSQHHGVGIIPTVPVNRTRVGVINSQDELLGKALELLQR